MKLKVYQNLIEDGELYICEFDLSDPKDRIVFMNELDEFHKIEIEIVKKYNKLIEFVKDLKHNGCCLVCGIDCKSCASIDLLREIGEIQ